MKKINFTINIILVLMFIGTVSQNINAQKAYGLSDIVYDKTTGLVTSYSATYLDYRARVHYDPAVCGGMFRETTKLGQGCFTGLNAYYDLPQERIFGSMVGLRTISPAPADTQYDVLSNHYVVAYFYTTVIILDYPSTPQRRYYDPLSLNQNNGQSLGSRTYEGELDSKYANFYESQYFYLGSTGRGIIANQSSCPDPASGNIVESNCNPPPLTIELRNEFKGNNLTSSSPNNALLGAPVELIANVSGGNNNPITYSWYNDNSPIAANPFLGCGENSTNNNCKFVTQEKKNYTIKVIVSQSGSASVTKQVTVTGVLPTLTQDLQITPYPVRSEGLSAIERKPRVAPSNTCGATSTPRLMLGCATSFGRIVSAADKDTAGFYVKAKVLQPDNLVSVGSQSKIEFAQFIRIKYTRSGRGSDGSQFTDELFYANLPPENWKLDLFGQSVQNINYKYWSEFNNTDTPIILDMADTPSEVLFNQTGMDPFAKIRCRRQSA